MEDNSSRTGKSEFERFVKYIEKSFKPWYTKSVSRNLRIWYTCQALSILCGFLTAIIAAFVDKEFFENAGKILLIVIPSIGSFAATIILQFRIFDLWQMRENGRVEVEKMISLGYQLLACNMTDLEYSKLHKQYIDQLYNLEKEQGTQFFKLSSAQSINKYEIHPS